MKTDIEIARETTLKNIREVAAQVGFPDAWRSSSSHAIFTGITLIRSSLAIVLIGGNCFPDFKFPFRIWVLILEKICK